MSTSVEAGAPVNDVADADVELDESLVYEDEDWDLEEMTTAEEVEKMGRRGHYCELFDRYCDVHVEVPKRTVEAVAFAKQSLGLERQLSGKDRALGKTRHELKDAQEAVSGARHSALAMSEEARQSRAHVEHAKKQLGLARDSVEKAQ